MSFCATSRSQSADPACIEFDQHRFTVAAFAAQVMRRTARSDHALAGAPLNLSPALFENYPRKRHNADLPAASVGNFKCPILKPGLIPNTIRQHLPCNHFGALSSVLIAGKFIALGNRLPAAHDDIEKIPWHSERISWKSKSCRTVPYRFGIYFTSKFDGDDVQNRAGGRNMAISNAAKADEYVRYAEHCLKLAEKVPGQASRILLREMAAEWLKLAQAITDARTGKKRR